MQILRQMSHRSSTKTMLEHAADESRTSYRQQLWPLRAAHKGYIDPRVSAARGAGRRIIVFGQNFSTKYFMLFNQLLFLSFFIIACVMYGISYASCWAWVTVVALGITLLESLASGGPKRDVLPSAIVRFLSCSGGWLHSLRSSRTAPRPL